MTDNETILWQRFMQGKGILNNFTYLYDAHKFDKRSMEQYLEDVAAEDVILNAFDFTGAGNTIFGFKYWKDIDTKWQQKLAEYRQTGSADIPEEQIYCPHCGRLRPKSAFAFSAKGVLHKHCRECEGGFWDKQKKEREKQEKEREKQEKAVRQLEKEIAEKQAKLERISAGIEPATPPDGTIIENNRAESAKQEIASGQANLNKTTKVCDHCGKRKLKSEFPANPASPDGLDAWCKKCQTAATNVSAEADFLLEREERKQAVINDATPKPAAKPVVTTAPIKPDRLVAPKLGEYDATLHYKKGQTSITFNATLSQQIRDGQYTKCMLNPDRSHRQFLIFNRVEGANITGASNLAQGLLNVNSADIVRALAVRFNLDEGSNYYLHITKNLAPKADVITVEVMKVRTLEEYVRIVEQREEAAKKGQPAPSDDVPEQEDENDAENRYDMSVGNRIEDSVGNRTEISSENRPLLDFGLDFGDGQSAPPNAEDVIQMIIDRHLVTERDIAAYLCRKGWELHEPVVVTKLKKFTV